MLLLNSNATFPRGHVPRRHGCAEERSAVTSWLLSIPPGGADRLASSARSGLAFASHGLHCGSYEASDRAPEFGRDFRTDDLCTGNGPVRGR